MNPDENPPPLPQPARFTCRNCGFGWNEDTPFCPRCGASQSPTKRRGYDMATKVALGSGFIIFGAMGACFSWFGFSGGLNAQTLNGFTYIGVALFGLALFLLWSAIRGGK